MKKHNPGSDLLLFWGVKLKYTHEARVTKKSVLQKFMVHQDIQTALKIVS